MERNRGLFIVFSGPEINQQDAVYGISRGYQCWNLKRFTRDGFIIALKEAIPPVNDNVLRNYKTEDSGDDRYGIAERHFAESSWGLMIPTPPADGGMFSFGETVFLLELYSPVFMYPLFYGSDFGISREQYSTRSAVPFRHPCHPDVFKRPQFVEFFEMLSPQAQYGAWHRYRMERWTPEDWRLFTAALLYRGLREYDQGKSAFGWQRESADMACVLEALFTAEDVHTREIGRRLRGRVAALLSGTFPAIAEDVRTLYQQRSAFVHGSFFTQMAKDSKEWDHGLPIPDYLALESQRERVRWALAAYLHLSQLHRKSPERYNHKQRVIEILETSVTDAQLRKRMLDDLAPLFALLPRL